MSQYIEQYFSEVLYAGGLNTLKPVDFSGAATVALPAGTTIDGSSVAALGIVTSTSANALAVGRQGATNPVLNVNAATASVVTGINLVGAAAAGGMAVSVTSSGTDESLTVDAKGAGSITLNATGTGVVKVGHGFVGATQALSGAGAVNLTTVITKITSTGANALTLADGVDGQIKILTMVADGGDATLTPTTKTGYSTIVFNDAGDGCTLVFTTTTGWMVVSNNGCTIS